MFDDEHLSRTTEHAESLPLKSEGCSGAALVKDVYLPGATIPIPSSQAYREGGRAISKVDGDSANVAWPGDEGGERGSPYLLGLVHGPAQSLCVTKVGDRGIEWLGAQSYHHDRDQDLEREPF